jgi:hypothetical protein
MNRASFAMKRSQRHNRLPIPELDEARKSAAETLAQVLQLLQTGATDASQAVQTTEIPQELIADLRGRYGAEMPYLVSDLAAAVKSLLDGQNSADAIKVIDKLCQAADSVASASFRRLRRR